MIFVIVDRSYNLVYFLWLGHHLKIASSISYAQPPRSQCVFINLAVIPDYQQTSITKDLPIGISQVILYCSRRRLFLLEQSSQLQMRRNITIIKYNT